MSVYYNEFNPESAAMLRQMMKDGIIPEGDIDERSITEVQANEIRNYTQCHFFAGIGGWAIALQLAGWEPDRPVWTGSCPCQPFSSAGRQKGKADDRHLWPIWESLISECSPTTIFGEQVASAITYGWLDDVYQGLEAQGYAIGATVLPACSVGSPHRRDRLWFVAHANFNDEKRQSRETSGERQEVWIRGSVDSANVGDYVADTECQRPQGSGELQRPLRPEENRERETDRINSIGSGNWENGTWVNCPDGKQRLIEPSICLLANGVQFRKPILHAFGNAIVPRLAKEFIKASMQTNP